MPISPYMDKNKPLVAELQESFIKNLVGTLCKSYNGSGLMPGLLIEESQTTGMLIFKLKKSREILR
jgi:hypothetical protein